MARDVRTHIIVSKELLDSVDQFAGRRGRSRFFAEAAEEKLTKARLVKAAKKLAGSLANAAVPGWETSESAAEWVRASRKTDDERLTRAWTDR